MTGTDTGNALTGADTLSESAAGTYSMSENSGTTTGGFGGLGGFSSANSFSLTETGSLTTTTNETGNTLDGSYTATTGATDNYSMVEVGVNSFSSPYSENVAGTDTATLVETGNTANQTYTRTTTDTDVYSRNDSGLGAEFSPSSSGTISSTLTETSDARAGILSQSETGSDRYSLLQNFVNVANTGSNAPGNMDYSTFGQPFTDPASAESDTAAEQGAAQGPPVISESRSGGVSPGTSAAPAALLIGRPFQQGTNTFIWTMPAGYTRPCLWYWDPVTSRWWFITRQGWQPPAGAVVTVRPNGWQIGDGYQIPPVGWVPPPQPAMPPSSSMPASPPSTGGGFGNLPPQRLSPGTFAPSAAPGHWELIRDPVTGVLTRAWVVGGRIVDP